MVRLPGLVEATHALPTAAVTAFCAATAVAAGLAPGRVALLAAAVLAGQASVGWMNDWVDAGRDRSAGRRDKPVARGEVTPGQLAVGTAAAGLACVALSLALGARPGAVHLVAVASAWAYNARWKATPASPLPYAVSFGLVPPLLVATALPGSPLPRWPVVAAGAVLGVAAHFANTVGDTEADARTAVRGLPQRIGPRGSVLVSAALVALGGGLLLVVVGGVAAALGLAVAAVAVAVVSAGQVLAGREGEWAFRAALLAVGLLVMAFVVGGGARLV